MLAFLLIMDLSHDYYIELWSVTWLKLYEKLYFISPLVVSERGNSNITYEKILNIILNHTKRFP